MIGSHGSTFGIRVKMSFKFWNWYKTHGSINLGKYNRRNGCAIRLIQEKGLIRKDRENLCLYIRNEIRHRYQSQGKKPVELKLKRDHLVIGELGMYDPVILVERLDIDLSNRRGLSMDKLMDPRLLEEEKARRAILGRLCLPGLEGKNEVDQENLPRKRRNSEVLEDVHKKKAMVSN
ncbi:unnamed protein product [Nippostrongylus brasiliensis]|uniref:Uncharacterized protein n=1 Tax=Nippostrongylus brasiliensis TaxID=27835 RepID=A0A0N4YG92_NIPBR|nr:unnamed protein product [Nippostrongylus brasiliensis]